MVQVWTNCCGVGIKRSSFILSSFQATILSVHVVFLLVAIGYYSVIFRQEAQFLNNHEIITHLSLIAIYGFAMLLTFLSLLSTLALIYGILANKASYLSQWTAIHGFLIIIVIIMLPIHFAAMICDFYIIWNIISVINVTFLSFIAVLLHQVIRSHYIQEIDQPENPWSLRDNTETKIKTQTRLFPRITLTNVREPTPIHITVPSESSRRIEYVEDVIPNSTEVKSHYYTSKVNIHRPNVNTSQDGQVFTRVTADSAELAGPSNTSAARRFH